MHPTTKPELKSMPYNSGTIRHGTHSDDWFAVEVVTYDLDGEPLKPCVHFTEGMSPDTWFLEPDVALALGQALVEAAKTAKEHA